VRAALGATRGTLARMVVADAMRPVAAGVVLGIALVLGGSKTLASWIFGVEPEPMALALATALLVAVGIAASLLPARRASRIDPITALRTR
jgi:ABC-type antimicrobial peptide transport system permease subunit